VEDRDVPTEGTMQLREISVSSVEDSLKTIEIQDRILETMNKNIDIAIQRGERLSLLTEHSDLLTKNSLQFYKKSRTMSFLSLKKRVCWAIFVVLVIVAIVLIILALVSHYRGL